MKSDLRCSMEHIIFQSEPECFLELQEHLTISTMQWFVCSTQSAVCCGSCSLCSVQFTIYTRMCIALCTILNKLVLQYTTTYHCAALPCGVILTLWWGLSPLLMCPSHRHARQKEEEGWAEGTTVWARIRPNKGVWGSTASKVLPQCSFEGKTQRNKKC